MLRKTWFRELSVPAYPTPPLVGRFFHESVKRNLLDQVACLVSVGIDVNTMPPGLKETTLHRAVKWSCETGGTRMMQFLLDAKADVNHLVNGWTVLQEAVQQNNH